MPGKIQFSELSVGHSDRIANDLMTFDRLSFKQAPAEQTEYGRAGKELFAQHECICI